MNENSNLPVDPHIVPGSTPLEAAPAVNLPFERPAPAPTPKASDTPEQKDAFREFVETVVFVVVLVLLLKAFIAEAFVIPTGSMATTLYGYHKDVTCPECGYHFPLNLSKELDTQEAKPQRITGCQCPNCGLVINSTNSAQFQQ